MKKIVSLTLVLCFLLLLAACTVSDVPEAGITLPEKSTSTDESTLTPTQNSDEVPEQLPEKAPNEIHVDTETPEKSEEPGESNVPEQSEGLEQSEAPEQPEGLEEEPVTRETISIDVPYWEDKPTEQIWPTESIVDDAERERIHTEYQKGYDLIKAQPWQLDASEEQLATNIPLLLDALSQLTAEETPRITYAHMKVAALTQDAETYLGELTYWARVSIDSVEQVAAESELAQALNSGSAFCIVHATTRHEEAIKLYVMDPDGIDSWYQASGMHSIKGWIVGADGNAVVLCVPGLSGG